MAAITPSREDLADRLQRALDNAGAEWAYRPLVIESISALRLAAKPADEGVRDLLIEKEAQRRCIASEYKLERLALQDRRFRHDDRRPWWKAYFEPIVRNEIDKLERAGFAVIALSSTGERKP